MNKNIKKIIIISSVLLLVILSSGCRKDFEFIQSRGDFKSSVDTVFLDSVFTNIASKTYNFKIYNTSDNDISIKKIYLENGNNSFYRINVDGTSGKSFKDVLIHKKDSIFIFVELTADITQLTNPVYEEKLIIQDESTIKKVILTAFVKDADFYYPRRFPDGSKDSLTVYVDPQTGKKNKIPGFFLPGNTTFTNSKPIVIYGHMAVPDGSILTIEQGAHLYFHYNSGLIIWENASLKVNGTHGNEVIFEDDRMEPDFENKSGMWNYIWLREGSKNNEINYAIIKNASIGVEAFPAGNSNYALKIKNTQIYNCSLIGIYGVASKIKGENLVLNNFGLNAFRASLGGTYDFNHCTFANFSNGIRNEKSATVYANNFYENKINNTLYLNNLEHFDISNSIISGSNNIEYYLDKKDGADFNYNIKNTLIKFDDTNNYFNSIEEVDFTDSNHYQNIILNKDPIFEDEQENKMIIGDDSPCNNKGDLEAALLTPLDIMRVDRTLNPDLGAYQHTTLSNN